MNRDKERKRRASRSRIPAAAWSAVRLGFVFFGFFGAPLLAQEPPPVEAILERYVASLGGREALGRFESRVMRGTFALPLAGVEGPMVFYARRPDRVALEIDLAGVGRIAQGYDGTTGWEDGLQGFRVLEGEELAEARRDAIFDRDLRLRELYPTMRVLGREAVLGRDAWIVEAVPAEGRPERFYFDAANGRLLRQDATRSGADGTQTVRIFYEEFFEADGVLFPRRIRQELPAFTILMTITAVEHDVEIPGAKFAPPLR